MTTPAQTQTLCQYGKCHEPATTRMSITSAFGGGDDEYYCDEHAEVQRLFVDMDKQYTIEVDEPINAIREEKVA